MWCDMNVDLCLGYMCGVDKCVVWIVCDVIIEVVWA